MCVKPVVSVALCQCFSPGAKRTTSPGRISSRGPPSRCVQPQPEVMRSVWPSGWVCQAVRVPGSLSPERPRCAMARQQEKKADQRQRPGWLSFAHTKCLTAWQRQSSRCAVRPSGVRLPGRHLISSRIFWRGGGNARLSSVRSSSVSVSSTASRFSRTCAALLALGMTTMPSC